MWQLCSTALRTLQWGLLEAESVLSALEEEEDGKINCHTVRHIHSGEAKERKHNRIPSLANHHFPQVIYMCPEKKHTPGSGCVKQGGLGGTDLLSEPQMLSLMLSLQAEIQYSRYGTRGLHFFLMVTSTRPTLLCQVLNAAISSTEAACPALDI